MSSNTIFLFANAQSESTNETLLQGENATTTQATTSGEAAKPARSGHQMWIFMGLMILVFWLLIIRPSKKRQKQIEEARNNLKKGDKIITAGGIHGKITDVKDNECMIEIADGVVIKIDKASIVTEPVAPEAKK
mgnify:FL=1